MCAKLECALYQGDVILRFYCIYQEDDRQFGGKKFRQIISTFSLHNEIADKIY